MTAEGARAPIAHLVSAVTLLGLLNGCGLDRTLLADRETSAAIGGTGGFGGSSGGGMPPSSTGGLDSTALGFDVTDYGSCAERGGAVWCWGGSSDTPGSAGFQVAPTPLALPERVTSVSAGLAHFCAVATGGGLYCWGSNDSLQLGSPDVSVRGPVQVALAASVQQVACGGAHTCVILTDGTLWCWGDNRESELGQPDAQPGEQTASPIQVGTANDWSMIALGQAHSCGLRSSGQLWCWGRNTDAQLGLGFAGPMQVSTPTRVGTSSDWQSLTSNQEGGCALDRARSAWCWGLSTSGRAGSVQASPVLLPTPVSANNDFSQIDTGSFHTCARLTSGSLRCWGRNVEGQLGLGTATPSEPPSEILAADFVEVHVGRFHTCASRSDGSLWCSGKNDVGQLGLGDTDRRSEFAQVALR